jgi:hypothetical protein
LVLLFSILTGIGAIGFAFRIFSVAYSEEYRSVLATQAKAVNEPIVGDRPAPVPSVPSLSTFTDSPGVRLAYRLPSDRPEVREVLLGSIFVMAWDAMVTILIAITIGKFRQGIADWFTILFLLPAFVYTGYRVTGWLLRRIRRVTGIGPTTVELSDLPLVPGGEYDLILLQYGKLSMKRMLIALVCEEVATYHFGTDTRTERVEVFRANIIEHGRCRIDWGSPLEIKATVRIPAEAMHSFQSPHNSVSWKVIVEGEVNRWPLFSRSFPVVVYPHASPQRKINPGLVVS